MFLMFLVFLVFLLISNFILILFLIPYSLVILLIFNGQTLSKKLRTENNRKQF
jgi:hypothetical protein